VALLGRVQPTPQDQFVFLGDYIDRGPASRQVIETLLELGKTCPVVFLRGNHEVMMLSAREDLSQLRSWLVCGGAETVLSYGANSRQDWASSIPDSHWRFFEQTRRFFETDTHIFVHACLDAALDLNDQLDDVLYWESFGQLTRHKSGKRVICGHTSQRLGTIKNAIGGWLTCLDVTSGKYWQADEQGNTRDGALE